MNFRLPLLGPFQQLVLSKHELQYFLVAFPLARQDVAATVSQFDGRDLESIFVGEERFSSDGFSRGEHFVGDFVFEVVGALPGIFIVFDQFFKLTIAVTLTAGSCPFSFDST